MNDHSNIVQDKVLNEKELKAQKQAEQREQNVLALMEKTGWTHDYALAILRDTRKRLGIRYSEYIKFGFYDIPISQQAERYESIKTEEAAKKQAKEDRIAKKNERYIQRVMKEAGWDRAYAEEKMRQSQEATGTTFEYYSIFRFWELTEDEQKTYFSKGDAERLREIYNKDTRVIRVFWNKDTFCKKYEKFIGRPWLSTADMTLGQFKRKFGKVGKLIYKPRASSGGHGIQVFEYDETTIKDVYQNLCELPSGIIEGYVVQHPEMQKLSLNSVNTIRVATVQTDVDLPGIEKNKVHFLYAGVRMGRGKSHVDNMHGGGLMAGIDMDTGIVTTHGSNYLNEVYERHPDTNTEIKGFQIPYFQEIKELISEAGAGVPAYLGWDIAITETGPIVIEVNTHPGAECLQIPYVPEKRGVRYMVAKYLLDPEPEKTPAPVETQMSAGTTGTTGTTKKKAAATHTVPDIPYGTSIYSMTKAGIEFYWKKPEAAAGYEVFRSYEKSGSAQRIAVINRRDVGTYIDSEFDHQKKEIFYSVRSFIDRADGTRVFSERTEPTAAVFREALGLEREATYLYSGSSRKIRALYGWGEAEDADWSSDNEAVATISADGMITAVAAGECTIRCSSRKLGKKAAARVVVDRKAPEPLAEIVSRYQFNRETGCWENPNAQKTSDAIVMMGGDMMCGKLQMRKQRFPLRGWNFNGSYTYARDITAQSDFAIGNLETLLAAGWPYMEDEAYIYNKNNCNAPSRYLDAVRYGGFDAVAMANNHNCDGEKRALLETIQQVDKYRLARTGVFAGAEEDRFFIADINGIKVGFLAYVSKQTGFNGKDAYWDKRDIDTMLNVFSAERAKQDITACRAAGAEYVIAYMHWGFKNFRSVVKHQLEDAQAIADAGVDYIVGSNPHVVQLYDELTARDGRKVPCIYSTGNFQTVMNQIEGNRDSALMRIRLKKDAQGRVYLAENNYIPCHAYASCGGKRWAPVAVSESFNIGVKKELQQKFFDNIAGAIGDKIKPV